MNPVLKYRGGKSKEIARFEQYIPQNYERYLEPFLGGGAVFFHLEPESAIINDVNQKLMDFYSDLRNGYDELTQELWGIQEIYEKNQTKYKQLKNLTPDERVSNKNENLYYNIRDMYNNKISPGYMNGTMYFFINKTAYSGMIRYNQSGEYNVPFGRYPNFNTRLITTAHRDLLRKAELTNLDYAKVFEQAHVRDFMFLDPPYDCIFNDYGNIDRMNGFEEEQHRRLANDFRNLSCQALMIIGRTALTEELYGNYIKDEYYKNYSVNIRNRFNADARHIIVANYDL